MPFELGIDTFPDPELIEQHTAILTLGNLQTFAKRDRSASDRHRERLRAALGTPVGGSSSDESSEIESTTSELSNMTGMYILGHARQFVYNVMVLPIDFSMKSNLSSMTATLDEKPPPDVTVKNLG